MPDVLYVGLQDDDKIVSFGIDAAPGKLAPSGETPAAGAPSAFAVSPDRRVLYIGYRGTPAIESCRIDAASGALTSHGARRDRARGDVSRPRPHRQISPVGPLPGRVRGRASARQRRRGERTGDRPAEHRAGSARDPDRPVEPLRLRAAHRPAERQRPGAAEKHPRPEFHRAVSVRRGHRTLEPQRAVQARPARADRAAALLLPSHARSRLFLRRAGVQRDGLPASIAPPARSPPWERLPRCPRA